MVWYPLYAVGLLLLLDGLARIYFGLLVLRHFESKPAFNIVPSPPDNRGRLVELPASDGLTLRGSYYQQTFRTPVGLVVFFPELDGNHWSAMNYTEALFDAGYEILSVDVRNQGDSEIQPGYEPLQWFTEREADDVRSILAWVAAEPRLRSLPLGVMGVSRGATAALLAGIESPHVRAVCCEGVYTTAGLQLRYTMRWAVLYIPRWLVRLLPRWHYRTTLAMTLRLSQWRRNCRYVLLERQLHTLRNEPILLIGGERDNYVPADIVTDLARQIGGEVVQTWIVPRARHNGGRVAARLEYDRRLTEFFQTALGQSATEIPVIETRPCVPY